MIRLSKKQASYISVRLYQDINPVTHFSYLTSHHTLCVTVLSYLVKDTKSVVAGF